MTDDKREDFKKLNFDLHSFVTSFSTKLVVWCFTGGGDRFEENFKVFSNFLKEEKIPILAIFSKAGTLVQNRYGLFWKLQDLELTNPKALFLFEDDEIYEYNIGRLLKKARIPFGVLPKDPAFSRGIWIANQKIHCIIASPLTGNSAAKLVYGISDTLIINILSSGRKAKQEIGIFPTERNTDIIKSKLPIRQKKSLYTDTVDYDTCSYGALIPVNSKRIEFRPEYCVGCQKCVQMYPEYFSVNEIVEIFIRTTDKVITRKLSEEFTVFLSPSEITDFIKNT